jgi:iduronate 2-sulfatase
MVESVDIYPTLCELAGLSAPAGLDGKSFVPVLRDATAPTKDHIIHVFPRNQLLGRAARTARYRLVEWKKPGAAPETAEIELYDYESDPLESKNLATEKPEVVAKLRAMLAQEPEAKPQIKANPNAKGKGKAKAKASAK